MSNILTGFNMQGNDPIDNRIVSPSKFETLEEYLQRVPIQKRYYGLSFYALDENNELRHYTFQTSLIEPTIDDDEEEIERLDKELQEHVNNKEIHKTSEEIRSEIVDADIPDTIARVQWTLDKIEEAVNTVMNDIVDGASDEYNTLKKIQDKIVELRAEMESQLYGDDGGEVLKTLEQALKFLNQYKDFIVDIPDNYVNKQDIVDNLNTDDPTKVLSARQGKVLSETLTNYFDSAMASIRAETNRATGAENRIEAKLDDEIDRSTAEDIRIQGELDAEEDRAQSEEKRIENKLDAEIERSTTKDTELGNQIIAETNRAKGEEQRIETKLDNEITRSTAKDDEHDDRIKALEGDTHVQNTDVGTTSQTFQLQLSKPGNKIKNEDAAISVRNADDSDYANFIAKNATFKGDLIVEGQSFVAEAETVEIKDNILLLNKGEIGSGVTKGMAGLQIDRGTEPDFQILFVESDRRFKAGEEGNLQCLALRDEDGDMLDGMFTTWDSATHRLKTTNIIPSTRKLFFNTNANSLGYTSHVYDSTYTADSFTFTKEAGSLFFSAGTTNLNLDTDKTYFRFYKNLMIPSSIISSGTSISLLNASGATIATFGSPSTINSTLNVANQVIIKGGSNTKLKIQSADADNFNLIESQNSSGTKLSTFGYYGTFWGIDGYSIATESWSNNKFLPLAGGTMTGVILMNNNVVIQSKNSSGTAKRLIGKGSDNVTYIGDSDGHTFLYSDAADIIHVRNGTNYAIYDSYNFNPGNYLPLTGGTLTGQLTIKQSVDIKLRLQSTDADNYCIIQAINAQASQLGVFGYAGDKWAIGHNGIYYEIWDKYNLTNPVTYTTNTYNHATLTNKDGQYFTYIKAGTNGLLPHSEATLVSGGSGFLGTSDQSFNAGYINNLHTNKVTFGVNGPYIIGDTSATHFLDANGGVQKVATGGLYVGVSYASDALNLVPTNGIYSNGNIKSSGWLEFTNNEWTDTGWAYKKAQGSLKVLSVTNEAENKPTSYGSVLQFNSRYNHWCTQIWCDQTNVAGVIGKLRFRTTKNFASTEWNPWTTIATEPYVSSNYLPLTGGTLSGNLTLNTVGSTTFIINNNDTNGSETFMRVLRKGTASAAIGFRDSLGAYIYNYNSKKYLFIDNDGYARVGTTSGSTRLALITDIPSISGYLPLSGGTMSGNISFNGDTGHIVVGARETSNYVNAVSFTKGSATNSAYIGYHSTGGSDSSGALILVPYSTSANPWAKTVGLYIAKNELLLDGKAIATQEYVTWNNVAGKPTIYERTIGINGTYWSFYAPTNATSAMIYGPTSAGTSGQILQSTGGVPKWVNASSVVSNFVSKSGDTMTGALTMNSRSNNIVVDVVGGAGDYWDEGAGALSIQVPNDSGQTPLILARRSGAAINTTVATERLLSMELLDTGHSFIIGMSGSEALQLDWTSGKAGTGKLFGKTIATTDQIPSLSGYATQSWANGQFASLSLYNTTRGYSTIRTAGNEVCLGNTAATSASNQMLVNYRIPSGCTYAPTSWVWRAGSSSSYAAGYWGNLYMNDNLVATQSWASGQFLTKTGIGASGTWNISITGNAATATTATKLGSSTVGSTSLPIYLNAGTPAVCSSTLGVSITGNAATATNATQLGGTAASSYVKANDNISRLTNDRNYVRSTSTLKVSDIQVLNGGTPGSEAGILYIVLE